MDNLEYDPTPCITPCMCTVCGWKWEAFFPDGIYSNVLGIECDKCREKIGRNVNGRFLRENEI